MLFLPSVPPRKRHTYVYTHTYVYISVYSLAFNSSVIVRVCNARKTQGRTPYDRTNRQSRSPPSESTDDSINHPDISYSPIRTKLTSHTRSHYQGNPKLFPSFPRGAIPSSSFAKPAFAYSIPSRSRADRLGSALPIGLLLSCQRRR